MKMWIALLLAVLCNRVEVEAVLINRQHDTLYSCNYMLVEEPQLHRDAAAEYCERKAATLATVTSSDQQAELLSLIVEAGIDSAWIGLFLRSDTGRWDDGSQLSFSVLPRPAIGEDSVQSGANVLALSNNTWTRVEGKMEAPFICSHKRSFMVLEGLSTHTEAQSKCTDEGMNLAKITTFKQAKSVRKMVNRIPSISQYTWFWVGGENPTASGVWQWSDGTPAHGLKWEKGVSSPREGPLYASLNKKTGRCRPLHGYFLNPAICQCPTSQDHDAAPRAQSDYGQINSEGKYVPLFRQRSSNRLKMIGVEHSHDDEDNESQQGILSYQFYDLLYTHGDAQSHCEANGGTLACPRNPIQQSLIIQTIRSNAWLGVVDVDEDGVYTCIGEEGVRLSYSNWYTRFGNEAVPEPDNMTDRMKPGASYTQILYDPQRNWRHGTWIDRGAPQYEFVVKSAFVCEKRIRR